MIIYASYDQYQEYEQYYPDIVTKSSKSQAMYEHEYVNGGLSEFVSREIAIFRQKFSSHVCLREFR